MTPEASETVYRSEEVYRIETPTFQILWNTDSDHPTICQTIGLSSLRTAACNEQ